MIDAVNARSSAAQEQIQNELECERNRSELLRQQLSSTEASSREDSKQFNAMLHEEKVKSKLSHQSLRAITDTAQGVILNLQAQVDPSGVDLIAKAGMSVSELLFHFQFQKQVLLLREQHDQGRDDQVIEELKRITNINRDLQTSTNALALENEKLREASQAL